MDGTSPLSLTVREAVRRVRLHNPELNALVQRLLSEEGASEGLVDEYVDQIRDPRDVNTLDYDVVIFFD